MRKFAKSAFCLVICYYLLRFVVDAIVSAFIININCEMLTCFTLDINYLDI